MCLASTDRLGFPSSLLPVISLFLVHLCSVDSRSIAMRSASSDLDPSPSHIDTHIFHPPTLPPILPGLPPHHCHSTAVSSCNLGGRHLCICQCAQMLAVCSASASVREKDANVRRRKLRLLGSSSSGGRRIAGDTHWSGLPVPAKILPCRCAVY